MKSNDPSEEIKKRGEKGSSSLILRLSVLFIIVAGASAFIVLKKGGAGNQTNNGDSLDRVVNELAAVSPENLPEYAYTSRKTQAGYTAALQIPDAFAKIPCYCSCKAVGHKSLRDCFLEGEDGFEEHASYCDICVSEALDVYTWQKQGLSQEEIRSRIDEKYSRYGEPTDTEEVSM